jgi:hypothetical protein
VYVGQNLPNEATGMLEVKDYMYPRRDNTSFLSGLVLSEITAYSRLASHDAANRRALIGDPARNYSRPCPALRGQPTGALSSPDGALLLG